MRDDMQQWFWPLLVGGGFALASYLMRQRPIVWGQPFEGIDMLCFVGAQHDDNSLPRLRPLRLIDLLLELRTKGPNK
jgi:hypothetical protein